jgi:prefoldin subunit 5
VLHYPTRSATPGRAALFTLLVLAALPAAAEAKNYKVDGRVTGAPSVRGGAVTVPLKLTKLAGSRLALGTRNVRVTIKRRARLPLSGSGAQGASRLRATGLQAGDRLRGVTKLTRKARKRMRYVARPTLKLKRVRVTRNARKLAPPGGGGGGGGGAAPRTFEQALAEMPGRVMSLNAKVGEFGSLPQQIEAQKLQLESLSTGLEGVTTAFESLTSALEGRPDAALFEGLVLTVEGQVARIEALEASSSAVEDALGQLESGMGSIGGALEQLTTMAPLLASQASLIKSFPGAEAQVMAIDETLRRIESRLGAAERAIGSIGSNVGALNAQMSTLAGQVNSVAATAASADFGTVQNAVNGLSGGIASLESAFGGLASLNGVAGELVGLEADALALEGMVEALCTSVPTACP